MRSLTADLLVIGGGATGGGVAWDAALRGYKVILVDRDDLSQGTSGRFHGMLHSGGRYAVKDEPAARECIAENAILRRIAPATIEDNGGMFVSTPQDPPEFCDELIAGCAATGIPIEEIGVGQALRDEPKLNPGIQRALLVPDASIDTWRLLRALADGVRAHGGLVLTYHEVTSLKSSGDRVVGAICRDARSGEDVLIEAGFTINAAGAWGARVAAMAGIEGVKIVPGRGIMIAMNHRLVNTVINRATMPSDGDIIVPIRTTSVIGTTDVHRDDPDDIAIEQDEVEQMLAAGEVLVPGFRDHRALRAWAGVRPLFEDEKADASDRDISRAHALLDHGERDGVRGFVTITGGKLTTYRLMAEQAVDAMCRQLGDPAPCTTAQTPLPGSEDGAYYDVGARLRAREQSQRSLTASGNELICECEMVTRDRLLDELTRREITSIDDLRRALRLGMGPCQGGFCMYRATGLLHEYEGMDELQANATLRDFLRERWRGLWPIMHGDQLEQSALDDWIYQGVLDVEHLP